MKTNHHILMAVAQAILILVQLLAAGCRTHVQVSRPGESYTLELEPPAHSADE